MILLKKQQAVIFRLLTIVTIFAFTFTFVLPYNAIAQGKVQIPVGAAVVVQTNATLSPKNLKIGDTVELTVVSDVKVDGKVVIKAGAKAKGEITTSKEQNLIGIAAKIGMVVRSAQAVDETTVLLSGSKLVEGKDKMAMSIGLSLICCILFGLMKGGDAFISPGTQITATVAATTPIAVQ